MKPKAGGVVTLVTAMIIGVAGPTAHAATKSGQSQATAAAAPNSAEVLEWEASTTDVTNTLWDLGAHDAKFSMVGLDDATRSVVVYRKGGAPAPQYVDAASRMHQRVVFKNARMSKGETDAVMNEIDRERDRWVRAGMEITATTSDGQGPVVVHARRTTTAASARASALPTTAFTAQFDALAPGLVDVAADGFAASTVDNRIADSAPFWGGALTLAPAPNNQVAMCTSGFTGVGTTNHKHYMVTAYHCLKPTDRRLWTGGSQLIGAASTIDKSYDLAFIPTSTAPRIYDSPGGDYSSQPVTKIVHPAVGQHVCNAGVVSLQLCWSVVVGYSHVTLHNDWGETYTATLWQAWSTNGAQMVAGGDSGGPTYLPGANGTVQAVGMNSAGFNRVGCSSVNSALHISPPCYSVLGFVDVYTDVYKRHSVDVTK